MHCRVKVRILIQLAFNRDLQICWLACSDILLSSSTSNSSETSGYFELVKFVACASWFCERPSSLIKAPYWEFSFWVHLLHEVEDIFDIVLIRHLHDIVIEVWYLLQWAVAVPMAWTTICDSSIAFMAFK